MKLNAFFGCLLLLCYVKDLEGKTHVIIYPKLLRVDVPEAVIINLNGYGSVNARVVAFLKDGHTRIGEMQTFEYTTSDEPIEFHVKAPGIAFHQDNFGRKKLILYVHITFPSGQDLAIIDEKEIGVIGDQSQIFVFTDRPIYRAEEKVRIRVAALDHKLLPLPDAELEVSISLQLHGETIGIWKETVHNNGEFAEAEYPIPESPPLGSYFVGAKLLNHIHTPQATAEFKVDRYVLPTFNVNTTLESNIVQPDGVIQGDIIARYTYGEYVVGRYSIEAKVNIPGGDQKTFYRKPQDPSRHIPGLMQGSRAGRGRLEIRVTNAQAVANLTWDQLIEARATITVTVSVQEDAGGVIETDVIPGILITRSAYTIDVSETSKYFVPSLHHSIRIVIRDAVTDKPVEEIHNINVTFLNSANRERKISQTDDKARATIAIATRNNDRRLDLQITSGNSRAIIKLEARDTTHGYLKITAPSSGKVDEIVSINFEAKCSGQPIKIYYMILCRGNVIDRNSLSVGGNGRCLRLLEYTVRQKMSPKIRVVGYYMNGDNIISDSLSISIDKTCISRDLAVGVFPRNVEPGTRITLTIIGERNANVSLVAVDRAAYLLNSNGRINRGQMFQKMDDMDMGCSFGGGRNTVDIFKDAGLALSSKFISTSEDRSLNCSEDSRTSRRKRNVGDLNSAISDREKTVRRKCYDNGRMENLAGLDCSQRVRIVEQCNIDFLGPCLEEFRNGCADGVEIRHRIIIRKKFARSQTSTLDTASYTPSDKQRNRFPENWLWRNFQLNNHGAYEPGGEPFQQKSPDSITTYEFDAISIHKTEGVCISKPATLTIFKKVFIRFYLPYSVKLNEEVQIRAAIFNYKSIPIQVDVLLKTDRYLCTRASQGRFNLQGTFTIESQSSTSFLFMAVPIKVPPKGESSMIEAAVLQDGVEKPLDEIKQPLRIEGSGVLKEFSGSFSLDPTLVGKTHTIDFIFPEDIIEESKECNISGFMTNLGPLIEFSTVTGSLSNVRGRLNLPYGCGEQNMAVVGPNVFVFLYLQTSEDFSPTAQDEVKQYIMDGYTRQKGHRNNGRWSVGSSSTPSLWLNAYVNKVFLQSQDVWPDIDLSPVCSSWEFVLQRQQQSGEFSEPTYSPYTNVGGDRSLTLTAYVLISMAEKELDYCDDGLHNRMADAQSEAAQYLRQNFDRATDAYTTAMVAYALSLINTVGEAVTINQRLKGMKEDDGDEIYWLATENSGRKAPVTIEATAYALLAQVKMARSSGDDVDSDTVEFINKIARWMIGQQGSRGGFVTTHATVVGIQSLIEYTKWRDEVDPPPRDPQLSMEIEEDDVSDDELTPAWKFHLDRTFKFHRKVKKIPKSVLDRSKSMTVKNIRGAGVGVLSYRCIYRTTVDKSVCDYNIEVNTEMNDNDLKISLAISKKSQGKSAMANVEVSLLSGFVPNEDSLELLLRKNSVDGVVDIYEVSGSKITFYVDHIPDSTEPPLKFGFRLTRTATITNVNPAQIHVYDYYNPEESQCSVFYTVPGDQPSMMMDCKAGGTRCKCLEESCVSYRNRTQQVERSSVGTDPLCVNCDDLKFLVCSKNYAYKIKVLKIDDKTKTLFVKIRAKVVTKLYQRDHPDTDVENRTRIFEMRKDCFGKCINMKGNHSIQVNTSYLVMGGKPTRKPRQDGENRYVYSLGQDDVIEKTVPRESCNKAKEKENKICDEKSRAYSSTKCDKIQSRIKICSNHDKLEEAVDAGCDSY